MQPVAKHAPLTSQDIFSEAIAVVPLIHTPVAEQQRLLVVGHGALAAAVITLRYPTFGQVSVVDAPNDVPLQLRQDRRISVYARLEEVPKGYLADLIVVAVPALSDELLVKLKAHSTPSTVVCLALPNASAARQVKDAARRVWPVIAPYREHLPTGGSTYFLLASGQNIIKHRVCPAWTRRIHDRWVPSLFTWAKDEYIALFGGAA